MAPRLLPLLVAILSLMAFTPASRAQAWQDEVGSIALQDGGRLMPLETFARRLAVQLTGRRQWSASRGPETYAGRKPVELFCDLFYGGQDVLGRRIIAIENRPFKQRIGLDPERRFFTAMELVASPALNEMLAEFNRTRQMNPQAQPSRDQRRALELRAAVERLAAFSTGEPLALVPPAPGSESRTFLRAGPTAGDPGTEGVRAALAEFGRAYAAGSDLDAAASGLRAAINAAGQLTPSEARAVRLEVFYDRHDPWRKTTVLYALSIVLLSLSRLFWRRAMVAAALVVAGAGVAEHLLGIGLRIAILGRAPVSNTFEALLWMGLVAIAVGAVAQLVNRRGLYLFGALCAALASVLFAAMVPLEDRTNSLPAVLRSNYWLIIHVLTIVASYGVLAVGAVLGHVYLAREVLFRSRSAGAPADQRRSHPLIIQIYRTIQVGLVLLTAGTILGGVWAADSWGRFWGWDPKETWALISILTYFAVLHARYNRWLRDFGLAAASIIGFIVIVWTFYGVNYVMASGLHSYGFGSGGEVWVALWAAAEIGFLVACRVRYAALHRPVRTAPTPLSSHQSSAPASS